MIVWTSGQVGTVGGGSLEFHASSKARNLLVNGQPGPQRERFPLGPRLGQCCGGVVELSFRLVTLHNHMELLRELISQMHPVAVFGAGHVGAALVQVLANLPFAIRWIDSREDVLPDRVPQSVQAEYSETPWTIVQDLSPHTKVVVMTHSHAEDFNIVHRCLLRSENFDDLPFIGLIGSHTKLTTFRRRLSHRDVASPLMDRIVCPIGVVGITDKTPQAIAVSVAAQLLQLVSDAPANFSRVNGKSGESGSELPTL